MTREIRITINDDEVFERMRHRKEQLDLSWEEALRRGLTDTPSTPPDQSSLNPFDEDFRDQLRERIHSNLEHPTEPTSHSTAESPNQVIDGTAIRRMVADHLHHALAGIQDPPTTDDQSRTDLDAELEALEDAEDAHLQFPTIDDDAATVPLRVNLTTTGDGLDVTVVAVRRGKGTEGHNSFAADHREQITKALATGHPATLAFEDSDETYDVIPTLSWGRTTDGVPTVVEVTIDEVLLED